MEDTATVATATPSSSTPSSTTSTATSEPSSVSSTTDRPSFGEALDTFNKAAVAQGRKPRGMAAQVAPPSEELPTTQADGTTDPSQSPATSQGPIPFAVHQKALENARLKARAEVEQQVRTQYGDPQRVQEATRWFNEASRDRVGFVTGLIQEALADPELAPHIASLAGRTLSGSRQSTAAADQPPQPDFTDGQGNQFFSAKAQQARDEWLSAQITKQVLGQVQPDLEQVKAERAQREQEAATTQLKQTMSTHLTRARSWPQFKEHEADIKAELLRRPLTSGHPAEEALLLRDVYDAIVGPKLSQLEQAKVVASLKERANASSLNPGATGAPGGIPKNAQAKHGGRMADALKWAASQTGGR
jgi:hypothetical protein